MEVRPTGYPGTARASTFLGGVPAQLVSDNLKAGTMSSKACFYDPAILNRTYADMAALSTGYSAVVPVARKTMAKPK